MTTRREERFPGSGLWSTTGSGSPKTGESFSVPNQTTTLAVAGPLPAAAAPNSTTTPATAAKGLARKHGARTSCWPQCKWCPYCPCARCCCPCTCCKFWCWLFSIILLFLLGIGVVVYLFWKAHPKFPSYNMEDVKFVYNVTGASSTNASSSSGPSSYVLYTQTMMRIVLGNPNTKLGINYDQIKLGLQMFGLNIGKQIVHAFYDGPGLTKNVYIDVASGALPLSADTQAALLAAQNAGSVPLIVAIDIKVRVRLGILATPRLKVGLLCPVTIDPGVSSGSQITGMNCKYKISI